MQEACKQSKARASKEKCLFSYLDGIASMFFTIIAKLASMLFLNVMAVEWF